MLEYFSHKLAGVKSSDAEDAYLLNLEDQDRIQTILSYIEDVDLRRWSLPDIRAFRIVMREWHSKLNCLTNPYLFEQVTEDQCC